MIVLTYGYTPIPPRELGADAVIDEVLGASCGAHQVTAWRIPPISRAFYFGVSACGEVAGSPGASGLATGHVLILENKVREDRRRPSRIQSSTPARRSLARRAGSASAYHAARCTNTIRFAVPPCRRLRLPMLAKRHRQRLRRFRRLSQRCHLPGARSTRPSGRSWHGWRSGSDLSPPAFPLASGFALIGRFAADRTSRK